MSLQFIITSFLMTLLFRVAHSQGLVGSTGIDCYDGEDYEIDTELVLDSKLPEAVLNCILCVCKSERIICQYKNDQCKANPPTLENQKAMESTATPTTTTSTTTTTTPAPTTTPAFKPTPRPLRRFWATTSSYSGPPTRHTLNPHPVWKSTTTERFYFADELETMTPIPEKATTTTTTPTPETTTTPSLETTTLADAPSTTATTATMKPEIIKPTKIAKKRPASRITPKIISTGPTVETRKTGTIRPIQTVRQNQIIIPSDGYQFEEPNILASTVQPGARSNLELYFAGLAGAASVLLVIYIVEKLKSASQNQPQPRTPASKMRTPVDFPWDL